MKNDLMHNEGKILQAFRGISNNRSEMESNARINLENRKKNAEILFNKNKEELKMGSNLYDKKMEELSKINYSQKLLYVAILLYFFELMNFMRFDLIFFIIQAISSLVLGKAASVWNMGEARPGTEEKWNYFWLFLLPFLPLLVSLYYLLVDYPKGLKAINARHPNAIDPDELKHRLKDLERENIRGSQKADETYRNVLLQAQSTYDGHFSKITKAANIIYSESDKMYPLWNNSYWIDWIPENKIGSYIRIGKIVEKGRWNTLSMPALFSMQDWHNIIIKASDHGKIRAAQSVQSIMLRMLTLVPPSKLRFILIDPVGHGNNVDAFLLLKDFDKNLVEVCTEQKHIEEKLTDITRSMDFIIQNILRNNYKNIVEYNTHAKETAEPYRVLVVFNFPNNFTDSSANSLKDIAVNGPRCGIYTIITVDTDAGIE
jgi:hypothetical protein